MPAALRVRLVDLPDDILLLLAELLSDTTINRLLQTCRRLRDALEHALYVRNARERNSSALQWAAYCGVMGSVKKALAAGADPNATRRRSGNLRPDNFAFDIYSSSILRNLPFSASLAAAAATGRLVIASVLIEAGALVDVRAHGFDSMPLVVAIQNGHLDMIKLLVASGKIDINSRFFLQRDCNLLNFAIPQASVEVVRYLLATIKRPDAGPDDWTTPLISAIRSNRVSVVRTLVESAKIDINKPDADGRTPFIWAVRLATKYPTMAQLLLDSEEVDVNAVDRTGRTALSWAAGLGNESMVQFLLETLDVDPNLADAQGTPPITHALKLLTVNEQPFGLQKDFLCYRSAYYRKYFEEHKDEEKLEHIVKLPDTSVQVFGLAQHFLFTGDVIADLRVTPSYEALVNLWNLGYKLEIEGLCDRALDAMTECRKITSRIPSTPLLVQVWKEAPEGSAIRQLLLSWTAEYMRSSAARAEFAKSLPQEVLSELVVAMSSFERNTLGDRSHGIASRKNVHYLEAVDGEDALASSKRSRRVSAVPAQAAAAGTVRADSAPVPKNKGAATATATAAAAPKAQKRRSASAYLEGRTFSTASKLDFCADLLTRMLSGPGFWTRLVGPFRDPVEPAEDGVPDYLDKVKRPMDLMTIKGKMDRRAYRDDDEFAADVRQIFDNCFTYWKPGQPMYEAGERLQRTFEDKYSHMNKWIAKMGGEEGE
ncbi:transcription regulator BDF1 [Cordyceps javanica]|nr:transcription regulator BDF1 [Cordyceps javanica]